MAADEQNKTVAAETAGTIRNQITGFVTGGALGAMAWGAVGAIAGAIAAPFLSGSDFSTFQHGLTSIGGAAGAGATIGAVGGGIVHSVTGAVVGAHHKKDTSALAVAQEKQLAYATGLVQGATLAKMEELEDQVASTKWQDKFPKNGKPDLFQDQVRQRQALAALAAMEPRGNA